MNLKRALVALLVALPAAACGRPTVTPTAPPSLHLTWSLFDLATSSKVACLADERVRVSVDGDDQDVACDPSALDVGALEPGTHVIRAELFRDGVSEWTTNPTSVDAEMGDDVPVDLEFAIAPDYGTQPVSWSVVDAQGNPVDCGAQTISFLPDDETRITTFPCDAGSGAVSVFSGFRHLSAWIGDGASGMQSVAVTVAADRTAPPVSLVFVP